jgi:predicted transcriptional regulator of viral defense system
MRAETFFQTHPVFRRDEFAAFAATKGGSANESTLNSLLAHHREKGRLMRVRRGIYAVVPPGVQPGTFQPDRYLIGAKAWVDGVLAFHTAMELHGYGHSLVEKVYV